MPIVRRLLARRHLAVLLCTATLLLRLLVPAGYMLDGAGGRPTVALCSGMASGTAMAGFDGGTADHGGSKRHATAGTPCAFAVVSATALPAVDPLLLAAPIACVVAVAVAAVAYRSPAGSARHRPPPRAPPIPL